MINKLLSGQHVGSKENQRDVFYQIFDKSFSNLTHFYSANQHVDSLEVKKNIDVVKKYLNIEKLAFIKQEHTDIVQYVDDAYTTKVGDALVTDKKNIALCIKTADCVCVMMVSIDAKVIACAHLGWKGAASDLLSNTISMMRKFSKSPIKAVICPCIRMDSYEVKEDFVTNFQTLKPESKAFFKTVNSKIFFDLPSFVKHEFKTYNIIDIVDEEVDTYTSEKYFSYRYMKHNNYSQKLINKRILSCVYSL